MLSSLIWFLLIGLAAGWLAGRITGGRDFGPVNNMVVGAVGAIVGGLLFRLIGLAVTILGGLVMATVGAIVVLYLLNRSGRRL